MKLPVNLNTGKIPTITFKRSQDVPKGWGREVWIANNIVLDGEPFPTGYSGKLLVYEREGAKSSMHYHTVKHETFYILKGEFTVWYYDPENADLLHKDVVGGDIVTIPPYNPHQVVLRSSSGVIIEFASTDYSWDNFRIGKGDSQIKIE
jgi:mannose-6-phosphate isomerase-like protein (cupin superfamily)